ncbi:hypothetical protein BN948_01749 [Hydrogenophaga intermedia]|uniref:Uncharacterized protein n=1 Tax=Hydrogenophaga intermedia TaxID=65786 RepID=A0A1L1PHU8_HYDIT|nr:hypothetical protein [Hydrogenophaga intermedia]CDN87329.1 hypothetical protein BN948_01749 [Hydrogenophaga intermedia]
MPTPRADSYSGTPGAPLYAGIEPPSSGGPLRQITDITFRSTSGSPQSNVPVTFGQPFKLTEFDPSTESLYGLVDGSVVPLQFDAVASHKSSTNARLAVISAQIPALAANGTKAMQIWAGDKFTQPSGSFNTDGWDPVVVATIGGVAWTAAPRAQLLAQIAANTGIRLNGPVAKEFRVSVPFKNPSNADHAHLRLHVDVCFYANGSIYTDFIFENGWLLQASPADLTYSVSCTQGAGGSAIFTQASFTHRHHARWHKEVWSGAGEQVRPLHNKAYFLDSKATWNYNRERSVASGALTTIQNNLSMGGTGPMATGGLTTDMPGTGGRDEIAPIPKWCAMWLLSQDERAWQAMLRNADASATAPVHFRDQTSGLPVDVVSRPNIAVRFGTSSPSVPSGSANPTWTPDIAHQGSYCYIPYLVTGRNFYLEEMTFWTAWNIAAVDPSGRGTSQGHMGSEQLRGAAWGFRSILECAFALPDNHAQKTYFRTIANNNIAFFNTNFTVDGDNTYIFKLGGLKGIYNDNEIPGYENDFFMYVASWAIENGETGLQATFNNIARYGVGRFTAAVQALGFCTSKGAHYWNVSRSGGNPITDWATYGTANGSGPTCGTVANGDGAYPDWAEGYAAVSRGMLGAATNAGHADGAAAYARWLTFTPNLAPDFANSPQYDIVPR